MPKTPQLQNRTEAIISRGMEDNNPVYNKIINITIFIITVFFNVFIYDYILIMVSIFTNI